MQSSSLDFCSYDLTVYTSGSHLLHHTSYNCQKTDKSFASLTNTLRGSFQEGSSPSAKQYKPNGESQLPPKGEEPKAAKRRRANGRQKEESHQNLPSFAASEI